MGINTIAFTDPQDGAIPPSYFYVTMSLFKTADALFRVNTSMFTHPPS
jgi:hypothetical protein